MGRCHVYSLITILLWSYAYVGTRFVVTQSEIESIELSFIRNAVAALIFLVILRAKKIAWPAWRDIPLFLCAGGIGFVLHTITFSIGLETITGGTSSVLQSTIPLITAMMASVLFKEHLSPIGWFAMLLAFGGAAILSLWSGIFSVNAGILWSLFAALCLAVYNILQRYLPRRPTRPYSPLQITAYSFIGATVVSLFWAQSAWQQLTAANVQVQIMTVCLGIFPSAIAFIFWSKAISMAHNLATVSNYLFLTPFAVFIVCYFGLNETPDAGTFMGGALILAGLWLFNAKAPKTRSSPQASAKPLAENLAPSERPAPTPLSAKPLSTKSFSEDITQP